MKVYIKPEGMKFLNISISSCRFLIFLFDDMIDFYQILSHVLTISVERMDVISSIREVVDLMAFRSKEKESLQMNLQISSEIPQPHWFINQD